MEEKMSNGCHRVLSLCGAAVLSSCLVSTGDESGWEEEAVASDDQALAREDRVSEGDVRPPATARPTVTASPAATTTARPAATAAPPAVATVRPAVTASPAATADRVAIDDRVVVRDDIGDFVAEVSPR